MPALHPSAAARAGADVDVELPYHRSDDRQILLILGGHAEVIERTATAGAGVGQRRRVGGIDVTGPRAARPPPVRGARAPSGASALALRTRLRKRRGLAEPGPTGSVQLLLDPVVPPLPPIAIPLDLASLALGSREVVTQPRDLLLLPLDQVIALVAPLRWHASVMTQSRTLYKYDFMDRGCQQ